jgi:hypothetical protein
MASKKCKGKIIFSNNRLKLDPNSVLKTNLISTLKEGDNVYLQAWTDNDIYYGKNKSVLHVDYITLVLFSHPSYSFENPLSKSSFYSVGFQKLSDFDNFKCVFTGGELVLNGEISFHISVKDVVFNDFKKSGLVLFGEVGIRVGVGLLVFEKYGIDWDKKSSEQKMYSDNGDFTFAEDRPIVTIL